MSPDSAWDIDGCRLLPACSTDDAGSVKEIKIISI